MPPNAPGTMPTETIIAKLAERETARISRDYVRSDAMRDELRSGGVSVDDRLKTWSVTDGRDTRGPRCCCGGRSPREHSAARHAAPSTL